MFTRVKTANELAALRTSGRMLATVLEAVRGRVQPGISTKELANIATTELRSLGGSPPFLGYYGFPDVICISLNNEVVHGIPSEQRIVEDGDIVSLDFGVKYQGMITDSAISVIAGNPRSPKHSHLIETTRQAMMSGIMAVHDGVRTGDIGAAVEVVLNKAKYGIVRDLVGHGVGHELHEDPNIPNYGRRHTGPTLSKGMTIAIEPMATLGGHQVYMADDGWTVCTRDGSWAAHFEHSVAITDTSAEILTTLDA